MSDIAEQIRAVTLSHRLRSSSPGEMECACGWVGAYLSAHQADALLPVVLAYGEQRAAEELERIADERTWVTEHDNEVVSVRDLYEQVAHLRGELKPVIFDDFPPDDAAALAPTGHTEEGAGR
jgi:alcohol dehydrogenase class IV